MSYYILVLGINILDIWLFIFSANNVYLYEF